MAIIAAIGFMAVTTFQTIHFFKQKEYKEIIIYIMLMAFALIYAISGLTDWDFPAPDKLTEMIFDPLSNFIFNSDLRK